MVAFLLRAAQVLGRLRVWQRQRQFSAMLNLRR